jgi:hypothetical protein
MSYVYELIGRLVVTAVRFRYQRELRIAAGAGAVGLLAAIVGGYVMAKREPPEG